jgi:hypothetical protein
MADAPVDADEESRGSVAHVAIGRREEHRDQPTVANTFGERAHDLAGEA